MSNLRESVRLALVGKVQALAATFTAYPLEVEYANGIKVNTALQTNPYLKAWIVYQDGQQVNLALNPDHRLIGQFAARYLFEMGHRAVMNVMCLRRYTMEQRLAGIKESWRAHNLTFQHERDLLNISSFSAKGAEEKVGAWLDARGNRPLPTAFLVGGDFMAAGTINALRQRGLRVPQDVSVMSIDGFNLAAIEDVPLTAVHVPRDELGVEAVQMLQQRLIRPDAPMGSLLLHGRLAVRESVRRVRPGKGHTAVEREGLYDNQTSMPSARLP